MMHDDLIIETQPLALEITVGTAQQDFEDALEIARRFDQGESVEATKASITFATHKQMYAVFTPARMEIIDALMTEKAPSIRALSKRLSKDYANIHESIQLLKQYGVVQVDDSGCLFVPYYDVYIHLGKPKHNREAMYEVA